MNSRNFAVALFGALLLVGGSAAAQTLQFFAPSPNGLHTWMPVDVTLDFDAAADDATLEVWLNGSDITSLFSIDAPLFRHHLVRMGAWPENQTSVLDVEIHMPQRIVAWISGDNPSTSGSGERRSKISIVGRTCARQSTTGQSSPGFAFACCEGKPTACLRGGEDLP